ncbi:MAG: Gfo/Idh/MocA family oxidoreductase [Gammaproteobacteria bacterium]|nr:Gfo/Idh/MocA family oxidoreductase [Gammaproteobacteria bacterium]
MTAHTPLKTAVIGVGYLGKFHAQKYASLPQSQLYGIVDSNPASATLAAELGCPHFTDYKTLVGKVDAVSIVTPTHTHFEIARFFLEHSIHVLLEKPMTVTVDEAQILIDLSKAKKRVLQIGYLERFNPIIVQAQSTLNSPRFIESIRIMEFNPRNKDVNVVLDLMIHDIDLITSIVNSPIASIDASGTRVLSQDIDIANARIHFENNCVANVTASRISLKPERKLRIFQEDAYLSLDLHLREGSILRKGSGEMFPGIPNIDRKTIQGGESDPLKDEIADFLQCILNETAPRVTGEQGKQSLSIALEITAQIHRNEANHV